MHATTMTTTTTVSATRGARAVKAPGARRADARAIGLGLCDRTAKASAARASVRANAGAFYENPNELRLSSDQA